MDITQIYNVCESIQAWAASEPQGYKVSAAGEYISLLDTCQSLQEKSPGGNANHAKWAQS